MKQSDSLTSQRSAPVINASLAELVLAEIDEKETIEFLQTLVRVPSVNPSGDTSVAAELCETKLQESGFKTINVGPTERHRNVVATLEGHGNGPRLAFNAHLDVVPIGEERAWRYPPFGGEIHNNRVYGRGAGDDKASVAAQVMAGVALARSDVPLDGTLIVTEVADEETEGHLGAGFIINQGYLDADYVIVGEQTQGRICVGERGRVGVEVTVFGAVGHSASPWMGANAIDAMARIITGLLDDLWPRLSTRTHEILLPSTATISLIEGGVKTNVIPDRCCIHIDRRILPEETPTTVVTEIREVVNRGLVSTPKIHATVEAKNQRPARMTDLDSPITLALQAATRFVGREPVMTGFFAGSDAKHFGPKGWPTLIMGPGDPATAHTDDEWVGIDEVMEATRLYALSALGLLGPKSS